MENVSKTAPLIPPEAVLQLHISEYQALTNRNTYLVTLQFSLWPILLVFLTLVVQVWNSVDHRLLVWGAALAVQLVGAAWIQLIWEQLNNINYLEERVRPLIRQSLAYGSFWEYEAYLAQERGGVFLGDYWLTLIAVLVLPVIAIVNPPFIAVNVCGLAGNLGGLVFLLWKTKELIQLRRRLSRSMAKPPQVPTQETTKPGC